MISIIINIILGSILLSAVSILCTYLFLRSKETNKTEYSTDSSITNESGVYDIEAYRSRIRKLEVELKEQTDSIELYDGVPLYDVKIIETRDTEATGVEIISEAAEIDMERRLLKRYQ